MKNFRKCLKILLNDCFSNQHSKELLCSFLWKNKITHKKVCLWWCIVVSRISHASCKDLPRVVKFYQEIFYKSCFFKHTDTASSEITKKQLVILNTVAGCYCLQSSLSQSSSALVFVGMKWKCYSISVMLFNIHKGNANLIGTYLSRPRKGYFC